MDDNQDDKQRAYEQRRMEMMRLMERHLESGLDSLADQACLSRFHFHRVFRRVMGETPGYLQRRLRLERAANELRNTYTGVTAIAFDAGYGTLEGFSRAFRRAYGAAPSRYRKLHTAASVLQGASAVHYDAQTGLLRMHQSVRGNQMDLIDRLLDSDYRAKRRILEDALGLTDALLDAPLLFRIKFRPWVEPEKSIREALFRITGDGWVVTLLDTVQWPSASSSWRESRPHTVSEMIERLDNWHKDYGSFVQHVKSEGLWDTTWIDADCEPAETFTYATVIEATLESGIVERHLAKRLLAQVGLPWYP